MKKKVVFLAVLYNAYLLNNGSKNLASNYVSCGNVPFPKGFVDVTHYLILLMQIGVPIVIILLGSIDFIKAITANNQDNIIKKQKQFIKRLIAGGGLFMVASIVQLVVTISAGSTNYTACIKCITKGSNNCQSASSPNNPDFPDENSLMYNPDEGFKQPELDKSGYENDGSNRPDGTTGGSTNNGTADLSTLGSGSDPNKTAADQGTTTAEPKGKEVKALFTGYHPDGSSMEGGYEDARGHKLINTKQTCAAPKSVKYGSIMWIKSIEGSSYQNYVGRPYVVTDVGGGVKVTNGVYHFDLIFSNVKDMNAFGKRNGTAILTSREEAGGSSSSSSSSSSNSSSSKTIFIGDSRTVGMCGNKGSSYTCPTTREAGYGICSGDSNISCVSQGYKWFENTAVSAATKSMGSAKYNIVIWLGVNDVYNVEKYISKFKSLAKGSWKNHNIIIATITPTKKDSENKEINTFNSKIKLSLTGAGISNLKVCDVASGVSITTSNYLDYIHYNKSGYQKVYNYIKNNCVK